MSIITAAYSYISTTIFARGTEMGKPEEIFNFSDFLSDTSPDAPPGLEAKAQQLLQEQGFGGLPEQADFSEALPEGFDPAALAGSYEAEFAVFHREVHILFIRHEVNMSEDVLMQLTPEGKVQVANDHPDRALIESLFDRHPRLREMFGQLSHKARLMQQIVNGQGLNPWTGDGDGPDVQPTAPTASGSQGRDIYRVELTTTRMTSTVIRMGEAGAYARTPAPPPLMQDAISA